MATIRVGRIAGTPVHVDWGLAAASALFTLALAFRVLPQAVPETSTGQRLVTGVITSIIFLLGVLGHEFGHVAAARRHRVATGSVTLSLLGGFAQLEDLAPTPRAEFAIGVAGATVNLVLGTLFGVIGLVLYAVQDAASLTLAAVSWLAAVNILLGVLNLVPALPLDGGRVLAAFLWWRTGRRDDARIGAGRVGLVVAGLCAVAGVVAVGVGRWEGLVGLAVAWFIARGAVAEIGAATIRRRLHSTSVQERTVPLGPTVRDSWTVAEFLGRSDGRVRDLVHPVVRWTTDPVGYLLPVQTDALAAPEQAWTNVAAVMTPVERVERAWTTETLDEALRRGWHQAPLMLVVHDPDTGQVVGGLSSQQIRDLLSSPNFWGRDRDEGTGSPSGREPYSAAVDGSTTSAWAASGPIMRGRP